DMTTNQLAEFLGTPSMWQTPRGNVFDRRQDEEFRLDADQFFVMGDNSPASSDARFWVDHRYVERDLLVGKALFVYWPHPWYVGVPFTSYSLPLVPNFSGMGLIR